MLARKYVTQTGSTQTDPGRVFGLSIQPSSLVLVTPSFGTETVAIFGVGVRLASHQGVINNGAQGFYFETGALEQFHVEIESTSGTGIRFRLMRGSTQLAVTSYTPFNEWVYLEVKVSVQTSTSGSYEMRLNGATDVSGTGVDTAQNGTTGWDVFSQRWSSNLATTLAYDDIYVCDGTGSVNNDFLGPQTVEGIMVTAEGASDQWTPITGSNNALLVDDPATSAPHDASNYVYSDTNGNKDLYVFSDLANTNGTVTAVQLEIQMAMAAAGTRTVKTVFRDPDTTEADVVNHVVDSTAYDGFNAVMEVNPASTVAWTAADINDGQFGMSVVS